MAAIDNPANTPTLKALAVAQPNLTGYLGINQAVIEKLIDLVQLGFELLEASQRVCFSVLLKCHNRVNHVNIDNTRLLS